VTRNRRKPTQNEYYEIQSQYDNTPAPDQGYCMATGEHWILKGILDRMGFYTSSTTEAYDLAGKILSEDYDRDQSGYDYAYH